VFFSLILFSSEVSALSVSSTFDANAEGWCRESRNFFNNFVLSSSGSPTHQASGGNPGGHIFFTEPSSVSDFFCAPSSYLGDKSVFLGGTLSFDLQSPNAIVANAGFLALLVSGSTILVFDSTQTVGPNWTSILVPLEPAPGWKVVASGCLTTNTCAAANSSQFQTVMSNLTALNIRGDWTTGVDTGRLDNVTMTPEPASIVLLLLGLFGLARRERYAIGF
jgi:hypothetical protein